MTQYRNDLRCPVCLCEYNFKALAHQGIKQCPSCKTVLQPLLKRHDGYIQVNWQDMRTLAIYALRWSKIFDMNKQGDKDAHKALHNIISNLARFQPQGAPQIVPEKDAVYEGMKRLEVQKLGDIGEGDNMKMPFKKDASGHIISPFFRKF